VEAFGVDTAAPEAGAIDAELIDCESAAEDGARVSVARACRRATCAAVRAVARGRPYFLA
jgi:hypothetical protein